MYRFFTYSHKAGEIQKAGTHDLTVTYTPYDTKNFVSVEVMSPLKIKRHIPDVVWAKPTSIQYSNIVTEKQLNAIVNQNRRDLPREEGM